MKCREEFEGSEKTFPKFRYFTIFGSGRGDYKTATFSYGTYDFVVKFAVNCAFYKDTVDSKGDCIQDYSKTCWSGTVTQQFEMTFSDSSYTVRKK
jgi:hypothetical protein